MMAPAGSRIRTSRRLLPANETVREASRQLREIENGKAVSAVNEERRQEARNRLDELFPGCATRYDAETGDVLDVDRERVHREIDRLTQPVDSLGGGPPIGPPPGPMSFGDRPFRP
jgi:hypothetical protein